MYKKFNLKLDIIIYSKNSFHEDYYNVENETQMQGGQGSLKM